MSKIVCRICQKKKSSDKMNHFSGYIRGEFDNDITICPKCSERKGYTYYFVHVPDVHIEGE